MTERHGLAASDAAPRWIGVRRHQSILVLGGLGLAATWVLASRAPVIELVVGLACLVAAIPSGGLTVGEWLVVAVRYGARGHWNTVVVRESDGDVLILSSSHDASVRTYELDHRGRLDLSGRDLTVASGIAAVTEALSAGHERQHLSQHVLRRGPRTSTALSLPVDATAPEGWRHASQLAATCAHLDETTSSEVWERPSYLRVGERLVRVYRVRDYSSTLASRPLLEVLARTPIDLDVALHVDVVPQDRAHRLAARAVHQVRSDDDVARAAGFRRSARADRGYQRLAQREELVAEGRALVRLAVYVVLEASSLSQLRSDSQRICARALSAGLRLDGGLGRQNEWFVAALPGGAGW